jgi:hypothetical protein
MFIWKTFFLTQNSVLAKWMFTFANDCSLIIASKAPIALITHVTLHGECLNINGKLNTRFGSKSNRNEYTIGNVVDDEMPQHQDVFGYMSRKCQ